MTTERFKIDVIKFERTQVPFFRRFHDRRRSLISLIRDFKIQQRDGNEHDKKKTIIALISKKVTLHVRHTFSFISLSFFFAFYGERKQGTRSFTSLSEPGFKKNLQQGLPTFDKVTV